MTKQKLTEKTKIDTVESKKKPRRYLLEQAISLAISFKAAGTPFSYKDIGLDGKINHRHRRRFKEWALANGFEFRHATIPLQGGSQDALFYPLPLLGDSQKILEADPGEKEEI